MLSYQAAVTKHGNPLCTGLARDQTRLCPKALPAGTAAGFGENTYGITNPDGTIDSPSYCMTKQKTIEIVRVTHLRGPNMWTYRPVIEAWVDIGELEDYPSNTLPGFIDRLCA